MITTHYGRENGSASGIDTPDLQMKSDMTGARMASSCSLPPSLAWRRFANRSIEAWDNLLFFHDGPWRTPRTLLAKEFLNSYNSLDDFLRGTIMTFWFFQGRDPFLAQTTINKWSRDRLDELIIIPASPEFVNPHDCFFMSHFWRTKDHPDPDGEYLRQCQSHLRLLKWSYIWVDWTCTPQAPRTESEETSFFHSLETISGLIRNCGFVWPYPPFEPRLWVLYEIAEFSLTSSGHGPSTPDAREFVKHIHEMLQVGVRTVLEQYQYRCTNAVDKAYLLSWLEILVLLKRLPLNDTHVRQVLDGLTWQRTTKTLHICTERGLLTVNGHEGTLNLDDKLWTFTPFQPIGLKAPYSRHLTLSQASTAQSTSV